MATSPSLRGLFEAGFLFQLPQPFLEIASRRQGREGAGDAGGAVSDWRIEFAVEQILQHGAEDRLHVADAQELHGHPALEAGNGGARRAAPLGVVPPLLLGGGVMPEAER